jgi:hypothetical protein
MKYTETRILHASDLRTLCIRENWYTLGDNDEYDALMCKTFCPNLTTEVIADIAQDIKDHSEADMEIPEIMYAVAAISHTTFAVDEDAAEEEAPMTELDILYAAYCSVQENLCDVWTRRKQRIDAGKPTNIADARLEQLEEKLDYLHNRILDLEAQEDR